MDEQYLKDQVALVTGASKGLGKAISLGLAAKGASLALIDVDREEGKRVSSDITDKGIQSLFLQCDLRKEEDVVAMVKEVMEKWGRIDILVNNAGIGTVSTTWELPTEVFDNIMAVNLRGTFLCCKYVVLHMLKQKSGRVVNIASAVGKQAQALMTGYATSKAGMISMTVSLAKEVAEHGINVNAVCPGPVDTPWWKEPKKILSNILNIPEDGIVDWFKENKQSIKKALKPEDVANMVIWLCSPETSMVTGQAISIDGGHEFPTY